MIEIMIEGNNTIKNEQKIQVIVFFCFFDESEHKIQDATLYTFKQREKKQNKNNFINGFD